MLARIHICDLCKADGVAAVATGTYRTPQGATFDACDVHLEETQSYGFTTTRLRHPGNISPRELDQLEA